MRTPGADRGGRPRTQGGEEDPLVTVSLHVRQRQLTELDQLADAEHTSRAALVREAIDRLRTHLKRPPSWRTGGAASPRRCASRMGMASPALRRRGPSPGDDPRPPAARRRRGDRSASERPWRGGDSAHTSQERP